MKRKIIIRIHNTLLKTEMYVCKTEYSEQFFNLIYFAEKWMMNKLMHSKIMISKCWSYKSTSWGCCLEIYSHTLLSHLLHFIVMRTSYFPFLQRESIRQAQFLITQIHPGLDQRLRVESDSLPRTQHSECGKKADMPLSSRPPGLQVLKLLQEK